MADQSDHKMEGVEEPTTVDKGKGKAPQAAADESEDSSDESAAEDQVCFASALQLWAQTG
jgi:hypothetical protein